MNLCNFLFGLTEAMIFFYYFLFIYLWFPTLSWGIIYSLTCRIHPLQLKLKVQYNQKSKEKLRQDSLVSVQWARTPFSQPDAFLNAQDRT